MLVIFTSGQSVVLARAPLQMQTPTLQNTPVQIRITRYTWRPESRIDTIGSPLLDDLPATDLECGNASPRNAVTKDHSSRKRVVPQNVPQRYANQAADARHAVHARRFLLSDFVSVENKERLSYFPKLKVASSILVARSRFARD
jgi:hypothetical protein